MDWITGISKAIDYIEEHITEPTDYARAAKEACSSPFNFQRVFALLCGYTLGDYVRMRRLTLANAASMGVSAGDIAVNLNDLITLPIGAVVSAAGLAIGTGIEKLQKRKLKKE